MAAVAIVGAIISAYATYASARAQSEQYKSQSKIAKTQAALSKVESAEARTARAYEQDRRAEEEKLIRERARRLNAKQQAETVSQGTLFAGSPLIAMADSLLSVEKDIDALNKESQAKQLSFEIDSLVKGGEAASYLAAARNYKRSAKTVMTSAYWEIAGDALSTAGNMYSSYKSKNTKTVKTNQPSK